MTAGAGRPAGGVAAITGAGAGLGAAMARRFSEQGMTIAAIDVDADQADATAKAIRDDGGDAIAFACDVADRGMLGQVAAQIEARYGCCAIVCANVGVQQFGAIDTLTEQDWRWILDVNVLGVVNTVDAFLPLVRKAKGARHIVVTSSSAAYSPGIRMAAYVTSKYAVTGYAETLRLELAPEGIGVSILFPAGMSTTHLQSSQRARPAELGPMTIDPADIDAMMASRGIDRKEHVATADYATRHLVADLAGNERYIITHGDCRATIERDRRELLIAQDRALRR